MAALADSIGFATAALAVAAWVVPPLRYALSFRKAPRDSLASVGRVIGLVVLTAILSAVTLLLAVLTVMLSDRGTWGWFGIGAIGLYWIAFAALLLIGDHFARHRRQESGRP
jgi:hypothetical protein